MTYYGNQKYIDQLNAYYDAINNQKKQEQALNSLCSQDKTIQAGVDNPIDQSKCCAKQQAFLFWNTDENNYDEDDTNWEDLRIIG